MSDIWISPKYRLRDWTELTFQTEDEWLRAAAIVEDRIKGRFVNWIDRVVDEPFSGFAVVALDCLFLETLVGFQTGHSTTDTKSAYKQLLANSSHFGFEEKTALAFYENVRNGIIHDTETRKKWIIRMAEPAGKIVQSDAEGNFVLYRTKFHKALKAELEDWLSRIRNGDRTARERMRTRMQEILDRHFAQ